MRILPCCTTFLLLFVYSSDGSARMWTEPESGGNQRFFINAAALYQPESHVQGGGNVTVSRYYLSAGSSIPVNDRMRLGFGLSYEFDNYNFSRLSNFAVPNPWNRINKIGFSARAGYSLSPNWTLFAAPVVQYSGEQGAELGNALLYGTTFGLLYRPGRRFMIGFGPGIFYGLEETRFFPAVIVSWKITDNLRLGNSFRTGPAGPAGLELAYSIDHNWETSLAGGFRSYRFRLDKDGSIGNGIGQTDAWPVIARLSRKLGQHFRADLYGGAAFGGKLRLEDRRGRKIDSVSYSTAPLAGFALTTVY